jgi:hypothetical protein
MPQFFSPDLRNSWRVGSASRFPELAVRHYVRHYLFGRVELFSVRCFAISESERNSPWVSARRTVFVERYLTSPGHYLHPRRELRHVSTCSELQYVLYALLA